MGKRSNGFEKRDRDFYSTPVEAVVPLVKYLDRDRFYVEPCAGDGRLAVHLASAGIACAGMCDIEPQASMIELGDATVEDFLNRFKMRNVDMFITNPPYTWNILKDIAMNLINQADTWLLLPADFMHNRRSQPFMRRCEKIVPIGRVKWIENTDMQGKDNYCWYLFKRGYILDPEQPPVKTEFMPRD